MTDINNFISEIVKEKDRLDMPVFLNFLRDELDRKGIELTVNRSNDLRAVPLPLEMSNIIGVKLDLSEHDKEKDTEIEKYKKAFEYAEREKDKQVCEYRQQIEELNGKLENIKTDIPNDPIKVADLLIDKFSEMDRQSFIDFKPAYTETVFVRNGEKAKKLCKLGEYYLRQIAQHLLIYCGGMEE